MSWERSRGKARPTLVRGSDLRSTDTASKPTDARTSDGRFAAGNRAALAARFTHAIRQSLGSGAATGEALIVARDARRVFGRVLASLASDAAPVRALLAVYARHQALHAYFTIRAEAAGLDTERGLALLEVADRQSQRAERTLVTCHDLSRVHAEAERRPRPGQLPPWMRFVADQAPTPPVTSAGASPSIVAQPRPDDEGGAP